MSWGEGDTVAAAFQPYRNRYDLILAKVVGFTKHMVRIEHTEGWRGEPQQCLIVPYKLVILEKANDAR